MTLLRMVEATQRVDRSERTLWRWQAQGLIDILPGGFVDEQCLVEADAKIRQRRILARHLKRARSK